MLLHKDMVLLPSSVGGHAAESSWKITSGEQAGRYLSIYTLCTPTITISRAQVMDIVDDLKMYLGGVDPRDTLVGEAGSLIALEHAKAILHFKKDVRWSGEED